MADETRGTVLLALAANLGVALVKAVGAVLSGSSALASEAAHSVADTLSEVFLLASLRLGRKPADRTHPFGYGKERFFWSLLAAVGIFVSGAGFSLYQGLTALLGAGHGYPSRTEFVVVYVVLAVSLVLEGSSLVKAVRQVRGEAARARRGLFTYVIRSPDPTVKTVASEDSVALVGIVVAFVGTLLHQLTRQEFYDGSASLVIAALLGYVAYVLGRDTKELLIGEAADPMVRLTAYAVICAHPEVIAVSELLTMQLGPDAVLVAARVQFDDELRAREVEETATAISREMHDRLPELTQVFLDPSRVSVEDGERVARSLARTAQEVRDTDGEQTLDALRDLRDLRDAGRGD